MALRCEVWVVVSVVHHVGKDALSDGPLCFDKFAFVIATISHHRYHVADRRRLDVK